MKKLINENKCSKCGETVYIDFYDYEFDYDDNYATRGWRCACEKCGHKWNYNEVYTLTEAYVEED